MGGVERLVDAFECTGLSRYYAHHLRSWRPPPGPPPLPPPPATPPLPRPPGTPPLPPRPPDVAAADADAPSGARVVGWREPSNPNPNPNPNLNRNRNPITLTRYAAATDAAWPDRVTIVELHPQAG